MIYAIITSIRTLTILPIPGRESGNFRKSLPFFPLAGAVIAILLWACAHGIHAIFPQMPILIALLVTGAGVVITGALHVDGLGDCADGFGGGKTRERILEIFKDSRLGTFGVTAVIFDISLKVILYNRLLLANFVTYIVMSIIIARLFQAIALTSFPYAPGKSGTAQVFTGAQNIIPLIFSGIITIIVGLFLMNQVIFISSLIVAAGAGALFLFYCYRTLGGITGDCIGALNEISEAAFLLTGCALIGR